MPVFKYRATNLEGQPVKGVIEAYDEFEAVDGIRQKGLVLSKIEQVEKKGLNIDLFTPMSIPEKKLAILCSQFSIMLRAGLPIIKVTELVAGQISDDYLRKVLGDVCKDVEGGHSLAESFENKCKILPATFLETVRAGEQSGTLEDAFARLYDYYDKSSKLKAKVKSAMMYPAFLLVVSVVVVVIVVLIAVPVFSDLFASMNMELPIATRMLLGMYDFFTGYGLILLFIIAAIVVGALTWKRKTEAGHRFFATVMLKLPVLSKITIMNSAAQFANTLSTMLSAGLPVNQAITVTGRTMSNYVIGTSISAAAGGIEEGKSMASCLAQSPYLPSMLIEMAGIGEETGSLESTLTTIGAFYDSEVDTATKNALGMLEPAIIVFLALGVAFIVMAVYIPMFNMYGGVGA